MSRNFDICTLTFQYSEVESSLFSSQLHMGRVTIIFAHAVIFVFETSSYDSISRSFLSSQESKFKERIKIHFERNVKRPGSDSDCTVSTPDLGRNYSLRPPFRPFDHHNLPL